MLLTREHVQRMVNAKASTPFAQRNFLNTLRAMFKWALSQGRIPDDPTLGVTRIKVKSAGFKTWSEGHIERMEKKYPIGSKGRLAFALILYTGLRRSDVVKLGRQHVHNGVITIEQGKTEGSEEAHLEIPMHPRLAEIIEATPMVGMKTFLVTSFGKPSPRPALATGSASWLTPPDASTSRRTAAARQLLIASPNWDAARSDRSDHRPRDARRGAALLQGG